MLEIIYILMLCFCLVASTTLVLLYVIDNHSNIKFFCNVLYWHKNPKLQESDGRFLYGECPRCHRIVYQDQWGDWKTKKEYIC
jgi:hypothetical protein